MERHVCPCPGSENHKSWNTLGTLSGGSPCYLIETFISANILSAAAGSFFKPFALFGSGTSRPLDVAGLARHLSIHFCRFGLPSSDRPAESGNTSYGRVTLSKHGHDACMQMMTCCRSHPGWACDMPRRLENVGTTFAHGNCGMDSCSTGQSWTKLPQMHPHTTHGSAWLQNLHRMSVAQVCTH